MPQVSSAPDTQESPAAAVVASQQPLATHTADPARAQGLNALWEQIEAEKGGPATPEGDAEPTETLEATTTEETPAETPKAKAKKAKEEPPPAEEPEEETEKVTLKNYINERQLLRTKAQERDSQRHQIWQGEMQKVQRLQAQIQPLLEVVKAAEGGDADAVAVHLAKYMGAEVKDWNGLQDIILQAKQSPVYKKMRDLERSAEADRKARQESERQAAIQHQERTKQYERQQYVAGLREELTDDAESPLAELVASRPQIVDAVFAQQDRHYQETNGEVLPAAKAAERHLKNVFAEYKFWSDFVEKHGDSDFVKKLTGVQGQPKKPVSENGARKTATSERRGPGKVPLNNSHTRTAAASAIGPMTDEQKMKHFGQLMQQGHDLG